MLHWPARPPFKGSNRFPGGTRKSVRAWAASNISSFRCATRCIVEGKRRDVPSRNNRSVSSQAKLRITGGSMTEAVMDDNGEIHGTGSSSKIFCTMLSEVFSSASAS